MLELSHVTVRYGADPVLRDVSLAFRPGQFLALIGPNGGGKSTLLRAAAGLCPVLSGQVLLDGTPLGELSPKRIARRVAYLPQSRPVPDITAWRMVMHGRFPYMGYPRHGRAEDREIAAQALEEADAVPLAGRALKDLSGGERQKIYVAMALAQRTDTILMDEPTTYMDIAHQFQTAALARRLAERGKAVVLTLHDLPMAFREADRIAVLDRGRLVCEGAPEELWERDVAPEVFGARLCRTWTERGWQWWCERLDP